MQSLIKHRWDDAFRRGFFDETGDGERRADFDGVRDLVHATVEHASEKSGVAERVINLVRKITSSGRDHGCAGGLRNVRHDLRDRIRETEDDRLDRKSTRL